MVERGYRNPPICKAYSEAVKENLTPVPESLVWGGMGRQALDIADVPYGIDEEDDDDQSVTVMLSDDGKDGEEGGEGEDDEGEGEDEDGEDEGEDEGEGASHDLGRKSKGKGKKPSNTSGVSRNKRETRCSNVERLLETIAKDVKTIVQLLKDKDAAKGAAKGAVIVKDEDALPQSLDAYDFAPQSRKYVHNAHRQVLILLQVLAKSSKGPSRVLRVH